MFGPLAYSNRSRLTATGFAAALTATVGAALSGGDAQAVSCNFNAGVFTNCVLNAAYPSTPASDKEITFLTAPSGGTGVVQFDYVDTGSVGIDNSDIWDLDVDFFPYCQSQAPTLSITRSASLMLTDSSAHTNWERIPRQTMIPF